MATTELSELKGIVPYLLKHKNFWANDEEEADILYLHFKEPNRADNSELLDKDIIARYEQNEFIGVTILSANHNGIFSA